MKIIKLSLLITLFFMPGIYSGGFDDLGNSARVASMGGSALTLTDAPYVLFYNPANIYRLSKPVVSTTYAKLYPNVEDDNLNFLSLSGIIPLDFIGVLGVGGNFLNTEAWKEYMLVGTYSRELIDNLSVGGSFKFIGWSAAAAPGEGALSYMGFSVDAGVFYSFEKLFATNNLNLGLSVQNINQPSIASEGTDGTLPMRIGLGVGIVSTQYNYQVTLDIYREEDIYQVKGGAEFLGMQSNIMGYDTRFLIRGGYNNIVQSDFAEESGLNGGFGLVIDNVTIDYAYVYPLAITNTGGNNKISLTYNF